MKHEKWGWHLNYSNVGVYTFTKKNIIGQRKCRNSTILYSENGGTHWQIFPPKKCIAIEQNITKKTMITTNWISCGNSTFEVYWWFFIRCLPTNCN